MYLLFSNEKKIKKTPARFSLRLTQEERVYLDKVSGDMPLGAYIRAKILDNTLPRKTYSKPKKKPAEELTGPGTSPGNAKNSRLSNNLNQLARAMNSGLLRLNKETHETILQACKEIDYMREELTRALGFGPKI